MIEINKKILRLCQERGWSNYELAQRADLTQSTLNSSLNRDAPPKIDTLSRICDAFGITLAQFFLEDEQVEILSAEEKELIASFRRMPPEKQAALLEFLQ